MSEAKRNLTEEKITAYALGELPEAERADIEARLEVDAALRQQVEEIRDLGMLMQVELSHEPEFKLSPDQFSNVLKGEKPKANPFAWMKVLLTPRAMGIEAVVAAAVVTAFYLPELRSPIGARIDGAAGTIGSNVDHALQMGTAPTRNVVGNIQGGSGRSVAYPSSLSAGSAPQMMAKSMKGGYYDQSQIRGRADGGAAVRLNSARRPAPVSEGAVMADSLSIVNPQYPVEKEVSTESYSRIEDNPFLMTSKDPLSTFSIDVDSASYANMRRYIDGGSLPPKDAVRIEEMINYFTYSYPQPTGDDPFSVTTEVTQAPWNTKHRLMKIGLKGKVMDEKKRPATNLVFLVDVSGSMQDSNKLPLLRDAFKLLVEKLDSRDKVSLVTYASGVQVVLPPTNGDKRDTIMSALDRLVAGGSTNGEGGIQLAYKTAQEAFIKEGANRVILATDGDFNVGVSDEGALTRMIEEKAKSGVFLSVLGFGMGNYKDSMLEKLSGKGNGNYAYIDTINEAKKVLVDQMGGTLFTIAKDVKLQLEFNPNEVNGYRLIGYENRLLRAEDFNDDKKDAGDIGAGHTVTAIYEIVPKGESVAGSVDALKYQQPKESAVPAVKSSGFSGELLTVKLRYKKPDSDTSKLLTHVVKDDAKKIENASSDMRWATAVAGFGMILRDSPHKGDANYSSVLDLAQGAKGEDVGGYRAELIQLIQKARSISSQTPSTPSAVPPMPIR